MTTIATKDPTDPVVEPEPIEVLIKEANQRGRRHRILIGGIVLTIVGSTIGTAAVLDGRHGETVRHRVSRPGSSNPEATRIDLKRSPTLEVYDYSGQVKRFASPVYFQRIGARTSPVALNSGMWASETPPVSNSSDLAVYAAGAMDSDFRGATIYQVGTETISLRMRTPKNWTLDYGSLLYSAGKYAYVEATGSTGVATINKIDVQTGHVVHTYSLAGIPYTSTHGMFLGNAIGGAIASLAVDAGSLYAFQYDSQSAAVDDLSNGTRHLLNGCGSLGGGVVAANGDLYVLAWGKDSPSTFDLLQIDPVNLTVMSTTPTGIRAADVDNAQVQALPDGGILAFVAQQRANRDNPMTDYLWKLSGTDLERVDLPANAGLDMRAFATGVYVFGGPARNVVTRSPIASLSTFQRIRHMMTPEGSWIFALT